MPGDRRQILSLLRLPIPPLQRNIISIYCTVTLLASLEGA